ncbi:Dynein heavy chain family protein [Trichomonas vaginalis G3]|uniref:Dynein heavy chain family protein n=1 Tax=Trichomonas vaginalis (strain ATCC PRA-98 / G3) TaxID=412133 RepID=A2FDN8_TRIV3|nr:dynein light chain binding [Trichomonas vaginalis G3]EAX96982.1 Dynein heavy chain family protein [Trichomonas vaginalis G3]KAI5524907.1 dynein light chain binding [Trichomonas vaginalis G3]|eukprot:XP_001309912.1 Dynein heavy chain family protein [Trichomonas vaginalis G3]
MADNPKANTLKNRLIPNQSAHIQKVTLETSIHGGRSMSRSSKLKNPSSKLEPLKQDQAIKPQYAREQGETLASLTSPFQFVEYARKNNLEGDFVYLEPQNIEEDENNPTRLRIVPPSKINKNDFWTISLAGLSHVKNSVVDFIPLEDWLRSCELFKKIMKIPFFKHYHQWKNFTAWKRSVLRNEMNTSMSALRDHYFLVHPILRPSFFQIQKEIQSLHQIKLFSFRGNSLYTLEEFQHQSDHYLAEITEKLNGFIERVTEMVQVACDKTMNTLSSLTVTDGSVQTSPLDHLLSQYEKAAHRGVTNAFDSGPSLTFTQRAANRTMCGKLVKFIKLVDACIVSALRTVCFNSFIEFYCIISSLHKRSLKLLNSNEMKPLPELILPSEFSPVFPFINQKATEFFETPVFAVNINLSKEVVWTPNEGTVLNIIAQIRKDCCQVLYNVPRLILNPAFRQYISPDGSNDRNKSDKIPAPDLKAIIESDKVFSDIIDHQNNVIKEAFKSLQVFSADFKEAIQIFETNEKFNANAYLENGITPPELAQAIKKYNGEIEYLATIHEKSEVGLFSCFAKEMKQRFQRSPVECLNQIKITLPLITRKLLSEFSDKIRTAHTKLFAPIDDVSSYVNYLSASEQYLNEGDDFQHRADAIRDFYAIAADINVTITLDEQTEYQSLLPVFDEVKRALSLAGETKQTLMPKFTQQLEKLIAQLHSNVLDVAQFSLDKRLGDPKTTIDEANAFLKDVCARLDVVKTASDNYHRYQKAMNIPVTRFEDVEELTKEITLKKLLWDTKQKWKQLTEEWSNKPFSTINPQSMAEVIQEYQLNVTKVVKGLPGNVVAAELKVSITDYATLLPIVTDLKNPALKKRFLEQITQLLGANIFGDEQFKFGKLFELRAFNYAEQIAAISSQATNEQALHDMLQNVQKMVSKLVFIMTQSKQNTHAYIFGGFDDILTQLDEAQSIVSTVRSSRYIAALRTQADEWARQLRLFSSTLEALMTCQRGYVYLSNVFSTSDIQRQLPQEATAFYQVEKMWLQMSKDAHENDPSAFKFCTNQKIQADLDNANKSLEQIQKALENFLETKRIAFPRFYFLSNDDLLDILAKSKNPEAVQPHLKKIFEGIYKLEITNTDGFQTAVALISAEGESVPLRTGGVKLQGAVEAWLSAVEENAQRALRMHTKNALHSYAESVREDWIPQQPGQIVLSVTQIDWCERVEAALQSGNPEEGLIEVNKETEENLATLAKFVRLDLTDLERTTISALITMDVHSRDIITDMIKMKVSNINDFEWFKRLKYYWDEVNKEVVVHQTNTSFRYGYEYLGCTPRLVITPLTDRCYLTLTGALHLHLGGSPAGPAGTGKTETVKDLAKALAIFCVVFNCSDTVTVFQMSTFFRGLAQAGAWSCFDEFNRINIEVLSVIAEQFNCIRLALCAEQKRFDFEGLNIALNPRVGCFITMNPGYAGRTELPDNLKALFRPVSMMIPDYTLIAEIMLYSQGFQEAKRLSQKMTKLYKLSSEMLSQQDHYDFGMRALKSVLVMAGSLKRSNPDVSEDLTLIRAMRDSNLAKFLNEDIPLFNGIVSDLFPGVEIVDKMEEYLTRAIKETTESMGLQATDFVISKVAQLHDAMRFRHGVMLVGPTCGGKSTVMQILEKTNTTLSETLADYNPVKHYIMNPKSLTMFELYGEQDMDTQEWRDGLIAIIFNECVEKTEKEEQWIVFDGPVDALWIENMNTVLDDNKLLSLANSKRIKMTPFMHLLFEVQDLAVASPATVSRCAMVYVDPEGLGWKPFCDTAIEQRIKPLLLKNEIHVQRFRELLNACVDPTFAFLKENCKLGNKWVPMNLIFSLFNLFECLITEAVENKEVKLDPIESDPEIIRVLSSFFVFAYVWSFGGHVSAQQRLQFDTCARDIFVSMTPLPSRGALFDYQYKCTTREWVPWSEILPKFEYGASKKDDEDEDADDKKGGKVKFHSLLVPTVDTTRFSFLIKLLIKYNHGIFLRGSSGVGKSVIIQRATKELDSTGEYYNISCIFSAHTTSKATQEMIESKLERKRGVAMQPPSGKKGVWFIDDINMPEPECYGAQPPIELLRQFISMGGMYSRPSLQWNDIRNVTLIGAGGPDGGSRSPLSPRFLRFMFNLELTPPDDSTLFNIFNSILQPFFSEFSEPIRNMVERIVHGSVYVYSAVAQNFLPTPDKSHYVFNLRDLANVIQGLMRARPDNIQSPNILQKLWMHENVRVYSDRLICVEDRKQFQDILANTMKKKIGNDVSADDVFESPLIFCDYIRGFVSDQERFYEELPTYDKARNVLEEYFTDYQFSRRSQTDQILFFDAAIQHISRICRILRQPKGHCVLVGVAGTGKRTLARFASFVSECELGEIEVTDHYTIENFKEDLQSFYMKCGVGGKRIAFIISDTQLVNDEFLEVINNVLNTGEIPNLFTQEDLDKICNEIVSYAKQIGENESRENLIKLFYERVRENFHVVLTMSPVGDSFRHRCRMFPSLVSCCTINWVDTWPDEALRLVSKSRFQEITDVQIEDFASKLSDISVFIHSKVEEFANRMKNELHRTYYITPALFIRFITFYQSLLELRQAKHRRGINRLEGGVQKLSEANALVEKMQAQLSKLEPVLASAAKATEEMLVKIKKDQAEADKMKEIVSAEEKVVSKQAEEAEQMAAEAQKELDQVLPLLEEATAQLKGLSRSDVAEVRQYSDPHIAVRTVMEAICILAEVEPTWKSAVTLVSDPMFISKISTKYSQDHHVPPTILRKLQPYVEDNPNFQQEEVGRVSRAARSLCIWATILYKYEDTFRKVEPKQLKVAEATATLKAAKDALKAKQDQLAEIEAALAAYKKQYDDSEREKSRLANEIAQTQARLQRAGKLTVGLADERVRWSEQVAIMEKDVIFIPGDSFLCAAILIYFGPFPALYRQELQEVIIQKITEAGVKLATPFSFADSMVDPAVIRDWQSMGLPNDSTSIENALIITQAPKSALIIDPQNQATVWIRNMEKERQLVTIKPNTPNFYRVIEGAARLGNPVLLEDVQETLDPALDSLLMRKYYKQDGKLMVRIGDRAIEVDEKFAFYVTTKLTNPLYMPDMFVKVSIVNMIVTQTALEAQSLSQVVGLERPELEKQKNDLVMSITADKKMLVEIEDKLLELLRNAGDKILDNEELINTIDEAKKKSLEVKEHVRICEEAEVEINQLRLEYKPVAVRSAILFFVTGDMASIDPMYQYSLEFFRDLVEHCIKTAPESEDHLGTLIKLITYSTYVTVSRGLFERHRSLFAFSMCCRILRNEGKLTDQEWDLFIRGPPLIDNQEANPLPKFISDARWNELYSLGKILPPFQNVPKAISKEPEAFTDFLTSESTDIPEMFMKQPQAFHKMLFFKTVAIDRLQHVMLDFISENLGDDFTRSPAFDLKESYRTTKNTMPLIFILSQGADPRDHLLRLATELQMDQRLKMRSLGQGQGPEAEKAIQSGTQRGEWIYLQNCHLSLSWLPELEAIVSNLKADECHKDFRLFLSSMPTSGFPVSILRNSIKVTNEPPRGIKAHLQRQLGSLQPEEFEGCTKPRPWKKLLFGLTFFHAVIQERKKFGPLGFNKVYEWTETDYSVSVSYLRMFLDEQPTIPWDALRFLTGEIIYGGRVTDDWDRRCMMSILSKYYCPDILGEGYFFSRGTVYFAPPAEDYQKMMAYVNQLPFNDDHDIFAMHENAEIAVRRRISEQMIKTLQSAGGASATSGSGNDAVLQLVKDLMEKMPVLGDPAKMNECLLEEKNGCLDPLTVVLKQEVERFQKMLKNITDSLKELEKALKGLVAISPLLENVMQSLFVNKVPDSWAAYPSLKPLGSWFAELIKRIEFFNTWMSQGNPSSFWLTAFSFPQSFLTGILQRHSRVNEIPIDNLSFECEVVNEEPQSFPETGVYIHGLFFDGAKWSVQNGTIDEQDLGQIYTEAPWIHLKPTNNNSQLTQSYYQCPIYITAQREGTLSTTGTSTNFVVAIQLPTNQSPDHWIQRGAALLVATPE